MTNPRYTPMLRVIPVAPPGAGNQIAIRPDSVAGWLVRTLRFQLVTSAVVANRTVTLSLTDTTREYYRSTAAAVQAASLTRIYTAFAGSAGGAAPGPVVTVDFPSDGLWIPRGHALNTITDLMDGGDTFSAIAASVIEFPPGSGVEMWPIVSTLTQSTE